MHTLHHLYPLHLCPACAHTLVVLHRWLPKNHHFRRDEAFGQKRGSNPPPSRTHNKAVAQGLAQDNWQGPATRAPKHDTGINSSCPLSFLHLFDVIWDVCPDMMHIIKNFFEKLTFKLFAGSRVPNWSTYKNPPPKEDDPDFARKEAKYQDALGRWEDAVEKNRKCTFPKADQGLVDRRVKNLVGPANWLKNSMVMPRNRIYTYGCIHVGVFSYLCNQNIHVLYTSYIIFCNLTTNVYIMYLVCLYVTLQFTHVYIKYFNVYIMYTLCISHINM